MLLLFLFFLVSVQAQIPTLCSNSPKTYQELQAILKASLKRLSDPFKTLNPFLPNLDSSCDPAKGKVTKCGYPSAIIQNANASAMVNNIDLAYECLITNTSKILHPNDTGTINDFLFQLRTDEALVYLACTPPSTYFSYQLMLYSDGVDTNPNAIRQGLLGDSLNYLRIKTWAVDSTNPRNAASLIILTAQQPTADKIQAAFVAEGFDPSGINVMALPTAFLELGTGNSSSFMTIVGRQSIYTPQDYKAVYTLGAQSSKVFPWVKLTPFIELPTLSKNDIRKISKWIPDYTVGALAQEFRQSEQIYDSHLARAMINIYHAIKQALPATVNGQQIKWTISPQRSYKNEDDGEKWVMEESMGLASGRDSNYNCFNPALTPIYDNTLGLGATVIVGLRHESLAWTQNHSSLPAFSPTPKPHALFWNIIWNSVGSLSALAGINFLNESNVNYTSLDFAESSGDPLGVIYVNALGSSSTSSGQKTGIVCNALSTIGINCMDAPATMRNVPGLAVVHRAYVDLNTGIYPSPMRIAPPHLLSIQGVIVPGPPKKPGYY